MDRTRDKEVQFIHRRSLEHGPHRHFVYEVENFHGGVARSARVVPVLIFVVTVLGFDAPRQALSACSGVPFAVTCGVSALWLRGMPFSIAAALGFVPVAIASARSPRSSSAAY
jgi:cobalt-zinc-cadmium resistance protein CzcA